VEQDRRRLEMTSVAATIGTNRVAAILPRLDWIHLGPLHPLDIDPELLAVLSERDLPVLLDLQGYTRKRDPDTAQIRADICGDLPAALTAASLLKASQEEMDLILAECQTGMIELMERFDIDEVVVTRGSAGGTVWSLKAPPVEYKSPPVQRWIDPTGAGDVFFAAYAVCRLLDQDSLQSAAAKAAELAAGQVSGGFIDTAIQNLPKNAGDDRRQA
jgi:sugar/nucleoside kinase (ribokinase family)